MSAPLREIWEKLLVLNREVDGLIGRVTQHVEPLLPVGREPPWYGVVEARFNNTPTSYGGTTNSGSEGVAGNNVKVNQWTNKSARVYIRELSFDAYFVRVNKTDDGVSWDARLPNEASRFPINWRWNIRTSITGRYYSENGRVLARAGGRARVGNHLLFKEPLVVEPMETLAFECEYLGGAGMRGAATEALGTAVVIALCLSGYREGV